MTLVRSGVLLTLAVGLANLLNAAFQFSLARILEPDEYALLAALFAIVIVAAIPPLAFQATAAREVSVRLEHGDERGAGDVPARHGSLGRVLGDGARPRRHRGGGRRRLSPAWTTRSPRGRP